MRFIPNQKPVKAFMLINCELGYNLLLRGWLRCLHQTFPAIQVADPTTTMFFRGVQRQAPTSPNHKAHFGTNREAAPTPSTASGLLSFWCSLLLNSLSCLLSHQTLSLLEATGLRLSSTFFGVPFLHGLNVWGELKQNLRPALSLRIDWGGRCLCGAEFGAGRGQAEMKAMGMQPAGIWVMHPYRGQWTCYKRRIQFIHQQKLIVRIMENTSRENISHWKKTSIWAVSTKALELWMETAKTWHLLWTFKEHWAKCNDWLFLKNNSL